jgi:hypothetical protein
MARLFDRIFSRGNGSEDDADKKAARLKAAVEKADKGHADLLATFRQLSKQSAERQQELRDRTRAAAHALDLGGPGRRARVPAGKIIRDETESPEGVTGPDEAAGQEAPAGPESAALPEDGARPGNAAKPLERTRTVEERHDEVMQKGLERLGEMRASYRFTLSEDEIRKVAARARAVAAKNEAARRREENPEEEPGELVEAEPLPSAAEAAEEEMPGPFEMPLEVLQELLQERFGNLDVVNKSVPGSGVASSKAPLRRRKKEPAKAPVWKEPQPVKPLAGGRKKPAGKARPAAKGKPGRARTPAASQKPDGTTKAGRTARPAGNVKPRDEGSPAAVASPVPVAATVPAPAVIRAARGKPGGKGRG